MTWILRTGAYTCGDVAFGVSRDSESLNIISATPQISDAPQMNRLLPSWLAAMLAPTNGVFMVATSHSVASTALILPSADARTTTSSRPYNMSMRARRPYNSRRRGASGRSSMMTSATAYSISAGATVQMMYTASRSSSGTARARLPRL